MEYIFQFFHACLFDSLWNTFWIIYTTQFKYLMCVRKFSVLQQKPKSVQSIYEIEQMNPACNIKELIQLIISFSFSE